MERCPPPRTARLAGAICLVAALASALLLAAAGPVAAQGWFGGLFGGGGGPGYRQQQPNYPGSGYGPPQGGDGYYYTPRHRPRRHPQPQAQTQRPAQRDAGATSASTPEKPAAPQKNASVFVDVFGDSFGQFLANGLDDALADRQDVAIVHRARGPTGLVTQNYFDWPKTIDTLLAGKDKIDVAVMMVGSNDRQPITQDGKTYDVGSDDWKRIYAGRVSAIDEAFHKKNIPLIWVGVPIAKSTDFADTMAMLNDITRDAAAKTGATYVDTWEAFSDDNGDFAAYGPDINGQTVRLRSADGILFTRAGARKLAHFVEAPIRRALDGKVAPAVLPTGTPDTQAQSGKGGTGKDETTKTTKVEPAPKPEAGPIVNLNQAPAASNGALAAPTAFHATDGADPLQKGDPNAAPPGRADDARWPAEGKTP